MLSCERFNWTAAAQQQGKLMCDAGEELTHAACRAVATAAHNHTRLHQAPRHPPRDIRLTGGMAGALGAAGGAAGGWQHTTAACSGRPRSAAVAVAAGRKARGSCRSAALSMMAG